MTTRRKFLAALGATAAATMAMPRSSRAETRLGFEGARHLLSRTNFGPLPSEVVRLAEVDQTVALDIVLRKNGPAKTPPPNWAEMNMAEFRRKTRVAKIAKKAVPYSEQTRMLRNWWVEELLSTDHHMAERMVLFWHNHFTSALVKVRYAPAMYRQNVLFRQHALGNFAALLRAVTRDPAMLIYLDGIKNFSKQPNENFARELLELYTLGEGHYSEGDVRAAARAFSGHTIDTKSGLYTFDEAQHDYGSKSFLDVTGPLDGGDVINILLRQPRLAEFIVEKMWREFVSPTTDDAEIKRLACLFRDTNYEIAPVLRALLTSPTFLDAASRGSLIKSPVDLIIGTVRVLGVPADNKTQFVRMLQGLGQSLFNPPNVKGWPGGETWITTKSLLLRQQQLRRLLDAAVRPASEGFGTDGGQTSTDLMMETKSKSELIKLDANATIQILLPPINRPSAVGAPAEAVTKAILDPVYQLK